MYLENKEKEVLYCGRLGPVWQKGLVTRREAFVKVGGVRPGAALCFALVHVGVLWPRWRR